jgi:hypothetical protein
MDAKVVTEPGEWHDVSLATCKPFARYELPSRVIRVQIEGGEHTEDWIHNGLTLLRRKKNGRWRQLWENYSTAVGFSLKLNGHTLPHDLVSREQPVDVPTLLHALRHQNPEIFVGRDELVFRLARGLTVDLSDAA